MSPAEELVEAMRAFGCPKLPTVEAAAIWLEVQELRRLRFAHRYNTSCNAGHRKPAPEQLRPVLRRRAA